MMQAVDFPQIQVTDVPVMTIQNLRKIKITMQHDFILIDRSGSMGGSMWKEALSSANAYVKKLAADKVDTGVTVAFFDTGFDGKLDFDIVRDRITPTTFRALSDADGHPRGGTPLSDAVGKIVALAEAASYDLVAIIIITDGHENASREFSVKQAKEALDRCQKREWVVTFLGANFQNEAQAQSYGAAAGATAFVSSGNMADTLNVLGSKRGIYAATGTAATMSFTASEKTRSATPKKPVDTDTQ
jgi:hypothetical protein